MTLNFELRLATINDVLAVRQYIWPERSVSTVQELLQRNEDNVRRGRGRGLVALYDKQIIAYGQLTLWPHTCEISDLAVAAAYRDQGIGTAIITELIEAARAFRMSNVEIGVAQSNPRALALYQRLGFREDRSLEFDLGSGPETVMYLVMQLR